MAVTFLENDPALQSVSFSAPLILQREILSDKSILEYFYESQFFDISSANQRRRKGHRVAEAGEGIEYVQVHSNDAGKGKVPQAIGAPYNVQNQFGVHIVGRVHKRNGIEIPQRIYYCISGTIYQAPSLQHISCHHLATAARALTSIMRIFHEFIHWHILTSYNWKAQIDCGSAEDPDNEKYNSLIDELCLDSDIDETVSAESRSGLLDIPRPWMLSCNSDVVVVPKIWEDDETSVPLTMRGVDNNVAVLYSSQTHHTLSVLQNEYGQLHRASQRIRLLLDSEAMLRPKIEAARRNVFVDCHSTMDRVENAMIGAFRSTKVVCDASYTFGCKASL